MFYNLLFSFCPEQLDRFLITGHDFRLTIPEHQAQRGCIHHGKQQFSAVCKFFLELHPITGNFQDFIVITGGKIFLEKCLRLHWSGNVKALDHIRIEQAHRFPFLLCLNPLHTNRFAEIMAQTDDRLHKVVIILADMQRLNKIAVNLHNIHADFGQTAKRRITGSKVIHG